MTSPSSLYILSYKTENPLTTLGFSGPVPDGPIDRSAYRALRAKDPKHAKLPSWERLVRIAARYREAFESTRIGDPCAVSRSVLSHRDAQSFLARQRAVSHPPLAERVDAVTRLGGHLHTKGKYAEAVQCFNVVLEHDATYRKARYNRALSYGPWGGQDNLAKAEAELRGLVKEVEGIAPETFPQEDRYLFALVHSELAMTLGRQDVGPSPEINALFERSLAFDGSLSRTFYNYGRYARYESKDLEQARRLYEKALEKNPAYHHARYGRASLLLERNASPVDRAEAIREFEILTAPNVPSSVRCSAFEALEELGKRDSTWRTTNPACSATGEPK